MKIGAVTIGQSPRVDVTKDIMGIFGSSVELIQAGGLDGLTKEEIKAFAPEKDDYVLVSRLTDGSSVTFAERFILPRLQAAIKKMEEEGCALVMMFCTGSFPESLFHRKNPSDLSLRYSGQGGSSAYQKLTYYLPDPFSPSGGAVRCKVEKLCTKSKRSSCLSLRRLGGTGKGGRGNKWHGGRSYCAGLHWIYSGNEKNVRTKNR